MSTLFFSDYKYRSEKVKFKTAHKILLKKMVKLTYFLIFAFAASQSSYRLKGLARRKMKDHHTKTGLTGLTGLTDHTTAASYNDFLSLLLIAKYETGKIGNFQNSIESRIRRRVRSADLEKIFIRNDLPSLLPTSYF